MKVTFACKCGWEFACEVPDVSYDGTFRSIPMPPHICRSPEPTYGPLTVEMVAEALAEAFNEHIHEDTPGCGVSAQDRFVIRLLEGLYPYAAERTYVPRNRFGDTDYRDWLLKLAREK